VVSRRRKLGVARYKEVKSENPAIHPTATGTAGYRRVLLARVDPDLTMSSLECPSRQALLDPRSEDEVIALIPRRSGLRPHSSLSIAATVAPFDHVDSLSWTFGLLRHQRGRSEVDDEERVQRVPSSSAK
jgi:hypothetical protein